MKLAAVNHLAEEVYICTSREGLRLRGIVHRSERANGRGLLLLPAGMKYRVGAHGFYVWMARQLARRGYTVLRADTAGIGYSDGPPHLGPVHEVWRRVEQGALVADAMDLAQDFRRRYQLESLVAGGICGAAVTAQLAVASDPRLLDGVLAINAPISLSSSPQHRRMNSENASLNARRYLRKLFSGFAWNRLLRGESDFSAIYAFVIIFLRDCLTLKGVSKERQLSDQLNEKFVSSYRSMCKNGVKVLYLFGGGDSQWTDFRSIFLKYYLHGKMEGEYHAVEVIPEANHELYLEQWQTAALESIQRWLDNPEKQSDTSAPAPVPSAERLTWRQHLHRTSL